jgi:hypothetical protein
MRYRVSSARLTGLLEKPKRRADRLPLAPPVPSLFRLMLISTSKRCEVTLNEIPAQRNDCRSRNQRQKFELYYDV